MSKPNDGTAPDDGPTPHPTDGDMQDNHPTPDIGDDKSIYEQLLDDPRITREKLARVHYQRGASFRDVAEYLEVPVADISRIMRAYGIAPGRGGHTGKENWIISHLPYEWAVDLCEERDIEPAPPEECYDTDVPRVDMPTAPEVREGTTAPDVPDFYLPMLSTTASAFRNAGLDPEELFEAARDYTFPDVIPTKLYVAERGPWDKFIGRFDWEEPFIGLYVALYEQADDYYLNAFDACEFLPEIDSEDLAGTMGAMLSRARVVEYTPTTPREYRLTEGSHRVFTGESEWDDEPLAAATAENAEAPSGLPPRPDDDPDAAQLAVEYWVDQQSARKLGEKYTLSTSTVTDRLRDAGVGAGLNVYPDDDRVEQIVEAAKDLDIERPITEEVVRARYDELRDAIITGGDQAQAQAQSQPQSQPTASNGGTDDADGAEDAERPGLIYDHPLDIDRPVSKTPHGVLSDEWLAVRYYHDGLNYGQIAKIAGERVNYTAVMNAMHDAGINPGSEGVREAAVQKRMADLTTQPEVTPEMVADRLRRLRDDEADPTPKTAVEQKAQQTEHTQPDDTDTSPEPEPGPEPESGPERDMSETESNQPDPADSGTDDKPRYENYTGYVPQEGRVPDGRDYVVLPEDATRAEVEFAAHYWCRVNNVKPWGIFVSLNGRNASRDTVTGLVHKSKMLHKPDEFERGDELVVELAGRKPNGDLNFRFIRELDGKPAAKNDWEWEHADAVERAGTYDHDYTVTEKEDVNQQTLADATGFSTADVPAASDTDTDTEVEAEAEAEAETEPETEAESPPVSTNLPWATFTREEVARLYYYHGLSQSAIGDIYDEGQASVSRAMREYKLNPGHSNSSKEAQFTAVANEYGWDIDTRGAGRPTGASAVPGDDALIEALYADTTVPDPVAPRPDTEAESKADAEAEPEPEPEPEPAEEPSDRTAVAEEPENTDAVIIAPEQFEAMLAGEAELPDGIEDTRPDPAPDPEPEPARALGENEVAVDRDALRRVFTDATRSLDMAPEGSELYYVAKGKEIAITDILADSDISDAVIIDQN